MPRCCFIADDFGMSHEVNGAIAELALAGSLHGASLMVDQKFTAHAVALAKSLGDRLPVGLHLNFSDQRDIGPRWQPFPWRTGFPVTHREARRQQFAARFAEETRLQFAAFRATGLPLAFVNGHHHLHIQPVIFQTVLACLRSDFPEFTGWIRLGEARFFNLPRWPLDVLSRRVMTGDPSWPGPKSTAVWGSFPAFRSTAAGVVHCVKNLPEGTHEFYFHPGADKSRSTRQGLGDDRQNRRQDFDALRDPAVIALARAAVTPGLK